jgi:transposase
MAYDVVFRKRVIEYKDAGHTFKDVQEAFGVDSKRYYSWKKQLEQLFGKANVHLLFLPAYSPDFNPIEKDWANMKRALRDTVFFVIC